MLTATEPRCLRLVARAAAFHWPVRIRKRRSIEAAHAHLPLALRPPTPCTLTGKVALFAGRDSITTPSRLHPHIIALHSRR